MGGVIVVNTVGRDGHWIFEEIARDGQLAVIMKEPRRAIEVALQSGGIIGLEVEDPNELIDAVASRLAPVTLVVVTAEEECEVPDTPHRWIAHEREGAIERILAAVREATTDPDDGAARRIARR